MPSPALASSTGSRPRARRRDSVRAEAALWARVTELGGVPAPGAQWNGLHEPVAVLCRRGHRCFPRPSNLRAGQGLCRECAGQGPVTSEEKFWAAVADRGARPGPGAVYVDNHTPVPLICARGHACEPTPGKVKSRDGLCWFCSRRHPAVAEAEFWDTVAAHGARRARGAVYVNSKTRVPLVCSRGHACAALPYSLAQGQGPCDQCHVVFDRVYLLTHRDTAAIKVGVASGEARVRGHRRRGYRLLAQWTRLDHDQARAAERAVLERWRTRGWEPADTPAASGAGGAVPRDGRTETTDLAHAEITLGWLTDLLGPPARTAETAETAASAQATPA